MAGRFRQFVFGFTLVEVMTVLIIASMIVVAVVSVFGRVRDASNSVNRELDKANRAVMVAQRIAEDLDRLAAPGVDTRITIENRSDVDSVYSRMIIETQILDRKDEPVVFERVTWQSGYDFETDSLVLYRAHGGINYEDKLIDAQLEELSEKDVELFVPVVSGLSYFTFQVPKLDQSASFSQEDKEPDSLVDDFDVAGPSVTYLDEWKSDTLPHGVTVTLTFSEPEIDAFGEPFFDPEDLYQRTIAVDRTRQIPFRFVKKVYKLPEVDLSEEDEDTDPNSPEEPVEMEEGMEVEDAGSVEEGRS